MATIFKSASCKRETKKAILVDCHEFFEISGTTQQWVPKSAVHDDSEVHKVGTEGNLILRDWFCEKKGWI